MAKRLNLIDSFDPTPEEIEKVNRAKPSRLSLCLKCKAAPRILISETVKRGLDEAFLSIADVLKSSHAMMMTRERVASLRHLHGLLCRASKARYCDRCTGATIVFVKERVKQ